MSKIKAVRLINLNYNNNAIKISDETLHFNGESTLLTLRNGGGKSVLVQMLTAPFVHKRYRDAKDRPFASYFTSGKPSFILVEWALDRGAGYVMCGLMVRRNQNEDRDEDLEMISVISEYREPCMTDIHNLPVLEKGNKELFIKSYMACRQMFEEYRKTSRLHFYTYDMNNSAQQRQYFTKLMEYQINYREWETIIKKINLKESGLSDLFADCRDEKGLVEKWFLDAVENKLNRDQNHMKEFQSIVGKYVVQYKDNQSKIRRRDVIRLFEEEAIRISEVLDRYELLESGKAEDENRISQYMVRLRELLETVGEKLSAEEDILSEQDRQLQFLKYAMYSREIYGIREELRLRISNRDMIEYEQEELERVRDRIRRLLHIMDCARQAEICREEEDDLALITEKLRATLSKEEETEPERRYLGYLLKQEYNHLYQKNQELFAANADQRQQSALRIEELTDRKDGCQKEYLSKKKEEGTLKARTAGYTTAEQKYNRRYQEDLVRNILGLYEPGDLEIRQETLKQEQEETGRIYLKKRNRQEEAGREIHSLVRSREDLQEQIARLKAEQARCREKHENYEEEIKTRKTILRYLEMDEGDWHRMDQIMEAFGKKLSELSGIREKLIREHAELEKEYLKLTRGQVMELPEEFVSELSRLGIPLIHGFEWMKKNGYSEEDNLALTRRHPFLPYALIMSRADVNRLMQMEEDIFTSLPVPVILREELAEGENVSISGDKTESADRRTAEVLTIDNGRIISYPGIRFYILFNKAMLNEENYRKLIEAAEYQISRKKEALQIRDREYQEYIERQELIRSQQVDQKSYDLNRGRIEEIGQLIEDKERIGRELLKKQTETEKEKEDLDRQIREISDRQSGLSRKEEDLRELTLAYEHYCKDLEEMDQCMKRQARLENQMNLLTEQISRISGELRSYEFAGQQLEREGDRLHEKSLIYEPYEETACPDDFSLQEEAGLSEWEIRYTAISSDLSRDRRDLELQEEKSRKRCAKVREELDYLTKKYGLSADDYREIRYDRKEQLHQEAELEDTERKIKVKEGLRNEENTRIAVLEQKETAKKDQMTEECGQDQPMPKADIPDYDFEERKNVLAFERKQILARIDELKARTRNYEECLTALAEYDQLVPQTPVEWEQDIGEMDLDALRSFQGAMLRNYKSRLQELQKNREQLIKLLEQILRMEEFQEDYYRKPLESMVSLADQAGQVRKQLDTTLASYQSLMEKIAVDLALVEKEKERIVELLFDYVRDVCKNLNMIDSNSTITIRNKPVKMLRLILPSWEDSESLYRVRMEDLISQITGKGIEIFERNENAEEYFGTQITTRNLFDAIIGLGNVQIKLYKIEAEREYPITWAEVAKNSGGEGFLSAFVILSSLLYYMRRDETDLFTDYNEGKVLIMDNPFAQTNASHLLKPLMDVARKSNTQLICLTGLSGDSIYNRFDNIYVLNLIAAKLRKGGQYLKSTHLRGTEPDLLRTSRVQVMEVGEQLTLF